jgi:2,3-bisphosphoglycerate-independent phosphoglycerate mutase
MKYVILIGDGMADLPIDSIGGRTPLEYAKTANLDRLAECGRFGLFRTVPEGMPPGSDVANLSILGYDPKTYYTGRAPLEAASIGVRLKEGEIAFRCNLVTLEPKADSFVMKDYSAGHISTQDADVFIKALSGDKALSGEGVRFYTGTGYRHLMVMENAGLDLKTTPPHDITDRVISDYLPKGNGSDRVRKIMERSRDVLKDLSHNKERVASGKRPVTSIWLWGQGRSPSMPTIMERFGIQGSIISAVDLMKGIGIYAGLKVLKVPGITGYIDTNYRGKAEYALRSLEENDFVCVHVEAPDEAGHNGNLDDKIRAIEDFDKEVVGRVLDGLKRFPEWRVLALCDHPTPISLKTHTPDPVPFAMCTCTSESCAAGSAVFSEKEAGETGLLVEDCKSMIEEFFGRPELICDLK